LLEEKGKAKKVEEGKKAREKQLNGVLSINDKTPINPKQEPKHNTQKELAKELNWTSWNAFFVYQKL